jgi:4-amino-4-deoxy-L-arabinose transferase-like glycosyltransferase
VQKLRPLHILLLYLALGLALRFFSFFPSVIDQDESTYILIADALRQGHQYQVDYVDTKPIGIFGLLALWMACFGPSIWGIRLLATLVLALTSWLLYCAKRAGGSTPAAALAAGVLYLFLNSIFTFYGVSPNTETFFNLFVALALWLYWRRPPAWGYFLAGLSLGLGFVIKYVVLFDGLAWGLFLLWQAYRRQTSWAAAWRQSLLMALGAALPFLALMLYYQQNNQLENFWFYTFTVSSRYPDSQPLWGYVKFVLDFALRFLPVTIFFALMAGHRQTAGPLRQFALLWSSFSLLAILLPGKFYGHYFIQFLLPFSFLAGEFFGLRRQQLPAWLRWVRHPRLGSALLAILLLANGFFQYQDYYRKRDYPREIAAYLQARLRAGETVYLSNDQIAYHLLGLLPPTRYVHPTLFWSPRHIAALEIDVEQEVARIKAQNPRFVVLRQPLPDERFDAWIEQEYTLAERIGQRLEVYERRK